MFKDLTLAFLHYSHSFADSWIHQYHVWLHWHEGHSALTGGVVTSLPSVQKNFVLLLIPGQETVISGFINMCHFEAFFGLFSVSRAFLSYLDKWSILNDCFHLFSFTAVGWQSHANNWCMYVDLEWSVMAEFLMCCLCSWDTYFYCV